MVVIYFCKESTTPNNLRNTLAAKLIDSAVFPIIEIQILQEPVQLLAADGAGFPVGPGRMQKVLAVTYEVSRTPKPPNHPIKVLSSAPVGKVHLSPVGLEESKGLVACSYRRRRMKSSKSIRHGNCEGQCQTL